MVKALEHGQQELLCTLGLALGALLLGDVLMG
jgi:hypothetical protein